MSSNIEIRILLKRDIVRDEYKNNVPLNRDY